MMGNPQSTIGGDQEPPEPENRGDDILDKLPPEKLLETTNPKLLRGGLQCMHSVETVKKYVGYENNHEQRQFILNDLQARAREIRE